MCMNSFFCRGLIFLFSIGFGYNATAQESRATDSLKKNLKTVFGKKRLPVLNQLHIAYRTTKFDSALRYANLYYDLALNLADSFDIVQGGRMCAYSLMDLGRNKDAAKVLVRLLEIAKRNQGRFPELKKQIKFILNNAGVASMLEGNYDKALEYHYES